MKSYKDLIVWQRSFDLVLRTYETTRSFPVEERYGITAQLRRSALSIVSNIAEGKGRRTKNDFLHFLAQARGSLLEFETQWLVATKLGYASVSEGEQVNDIAHGCGRLLNGLMRVLRSAES